MSTEKKTTFLEKILFPIAFVALMWIAHMINEFSFHTFDSFGIYPRYFDGMLGIIFAPLIHGDWMHLISNTMPMIILMTILFLFYKKVAFPSFIFIYIITGLLVWIFARPSYHIGASGVVYGLVAFIFWSGVFRRNLRSIILALVILVMYSGYFLGILPSEPGVSWESHLLGGVAGIITAFIFKNVLEIDEKIDETPELEYTERTYFLERDTFDMTLEERKKLEQQQQWLDWFSSRSIDP